MVRGGKKVGKHCFTPKRMAFYAHVKGLREPDFNMIICFVNYNNYYPARVHLNEIIFAATKKKYIILVGSRRASKMVL
jgi:hypothetical protein